MNKDTNTTTTVGNKSQKGQSPLVRPAFDPGPKGRVAAHTGADHSSLGSFSHANRMCFQPSMSTDVQTSHAKAKMASLAHKPTLLSLSHSTGISLSATSPLLASLGSFSSATSSQHVSRSKESPATTRSATSVCARIACAERGPVAFSLLALPFQKPNSHSIYFLPFFSVYYLKNER
jgi:hypothetical protein